MDTTEWTAHIGKGKRAVVTGGAGFFGSHLCATLLDHGFSVIAIDRMTGGSFPTSSTMLARSTIGWTPRVTPDEGLLRTITWFDDLPGRDAQPPEVRDAVA